MASFTTPAFQTKFNIFGVGQPPATFPPYTNQPGQLYTHSRSDIEIQPNNPIIYVPNIKIRFGPTIFVYMLLPAVGAYMQMTDPNGDVWTYRVRFWEWCHMDFTNQYVEMTVQQCSPAGVIPDPGR